MGGKLYNLPRMPQTQYLEREMHLRDALTPLLEGKFHIPRFYGNKPDFGDMDVIVAQRPDWATFRLELVQHLGIGEYKTVGAVFSTVYDGLQTDFFTVPEKYLHSTYTFMCFNDLGNLLGRMVRRFNLKWGEQGLSYVFRRLEGAYSADLELTQDFARVCEFLHLDYAQWQRGFDSLEGMFEWVMCSPYFSVAPYLDDLEGKLEKRLRERPTMRRFIEYLREHNHQQRPQFAERYSYLSWITQSFPEADLLGQVALEQAKETRSLELAKKFNGRLVMRLFPALEGKELGAFIVAFKEFLGDFESFFLEADDAQIERKLLEFGKDYPVR
jgi:hypothetical protein